MRGWLKSAPYCRFRENGTVIQGPPATTDSGATEVDRGYPREDSLCRKDRIDLKRFPYPSSVSDSAQPSTARRHLAVNVVIGAFLMLATLPGRTQGLGLITEPLLAEGSLDRVLFAKLNLWASLLGAFLCLAVGRWIDRVGLRPVSVLLLGGLAIATLGLSLHPGGAVLLFAWLFLSRALGQSGLSVAAISSVAKAGTGKNAPALGWFSLLLSLLFIAAFVTVGGLVESSGWRIAWRSVAGGIGLFILPLAIVFLREPPRAEPDNTTTDGGPGTGLREALRTPLFWIASGAVASFAFASSGLGLFNEAVLAEVGQSRQTYHLFLAVTTGFALLGQVLCGWLSARRPLAVLLGLSLAAYALSLAALAHANEAVLLWTAAGLMGMAAGFVTVLFFAIWGDAYGRRELGRIQGVAQGLTVLASALGPLVFAFVHDRSGSYAPALYGLAAAALAFAIASLAITPKGNASPIPR